MKYTMLLAVAVATMLTIQVRSAPSSCQSHTLGNRIVARIGRTPIAYAQIRIDRRLIPILCPNVQKATDVDNLACAWESRRLAAIIRNTVVDQKAAELGLSVPPDEVKQEVDRRFRSAGIDSDVARRLNETHTLLAEALQERLSDSARSDHVYAQKLAHTQITKTQWQVYQVLFDSPQKLDRLRSLIPSSVEDMKRNSRESCRRDLLLEKLRMAMSPAAKTPSLEGHDADPRADSPRSPALLTETRRSGISSSSDEVRHWWTDVVEGVRIEILDNRYRVAVRSHMGATATFPEAVVE